PVRNSRLLTKLFILDLEAHPPGAAIHRVEVEAIPAKPRVVQNGLFVPLSPEPEKLQLTLARLKAVVGEENVGSPEILDTHRPDGFRLKTFGMSQGGNGTNGRNEKVPSLEKEGWPRHQVNGPVPLKGVDGVVSLTTPAAPAMEASQHFLNGRSHPSFI